MKAIAKLISIGSEALGGPEPPTPSFVASNSTLGAELLGLLRQRNGFYAFEGALHVLPSGSLRAAMGVEEWNSNALWRYEYGDLAEGLFFFAEDAFGNQFCLAEDGVCSFDAETGETELVAGSVEEWAHRVLSDYDFLTGFPLCHEWQLAHGRIPMGSRLVPKTPFVLGGEYSLANLRVVGAVSGMRSRGNLARQIRDLPDGAQVQFKVID